jgi:chromosome segregation ATPase
MGEKLQYYQTQAVDAIQARDRAQRESEELRVQINQLKATCATSAADLKAANSELVESRHRLEVQAREIASLQKRAEQATQLPTLRLQLDQRLEEFDAEVERRHAAEVRSR